ncbi:hypothetical protein QCM80_07400 [Bradyrhizobium sp. SSUT112]|uniref:hypothetical protein n=1 Tax=Bradyrhizobium sp. SSUT112 TaxID=3040604 RepID=UPI00244A7EB7|nr:hypothetical protein [Bradyrhizobium sp. SSUT112]MDH2350496.1 hypothetical protein [Bradyrhizobium sp. SSUT112]
MPNAPDVHICEVGPRDGLQNLDIFVPTDAKCALIDAIVAAGVREVDAGSFVPPKVVPQFADVDIVMAHALAHKAITMGALVPHFKGAERAVAAGVNAVGFLQREGRDKCQTSRQSPKPYGRHLDGLRLLNGGSHR